MMMLQALMAVADNDSKTEIYT